MYNPVFDESGWVTYEHEKSFCLEDAELRVLEKNGWSGFLPLCSRDLLSLVCIFLPQQWTHWGWDLKNKTKERKCLSEIARATLWDFPG